VIFSMWNPEKIRHQEVINLLTSPGSGLVQPFMQGSRT